ncbi:hypothetical protein PYCC9005_000879 [Savitreella phatthalungensis]
MLKLKIKGLKSQSSTKRKRRQSQAIVLEAADIQGTQGREDTLDGDTNAATFFDSDTSSLTSLDDFVYGNLEADENESDIEAFESAAILQEAEDDDLLRKQNFYTIDESQPFAYLEGRDDMETEFEALWPGDEADAATPLSMANADDLLEQLFFAPTVKDYTNGIERAGCTLDVLQTERQDESGEDTDDPEDRVGWECFFSSGSGDESESSDAETATDDSSTDEETPQLTTATPLRRPIPIAQTGPSPAHPSTPWALAVQHAPLLGSWVKDSRKRTSIIDGRSIGSLARRPSQSSRRQIPGSPYERSGAMHDAMTTLDEILYTNELLVETSDHAAEDSEEYQEEGHKHQPGRATAARHFERSLSIDTDSRSVPVGAFRKAQQRASLSRQDSFKDEWYLLTAKNRSRLRRKQSAPVLGLASESLQKSAVQKRNQRSQLKQNLRSQQPPTPPLRAKTPSQILYELEGSSESVPFFENLPSFESLWTC